MGPMTTIAFLGTGLMGQPMAERLLATGHEVVVRRATSASRRAR